MCFSLQGSVCDFLTSEAESTDGTIEGKATLVKPHTCSCINGVLKHCLVMQDLVYSPPGSTESSEEASWWVFWLAHEKAALQVSARVPRPRPSISMSARCFLWQGVGSARPSSAGGCQWDYYDFTRPCCSGCSFPHSLNSREGLDWSYKDFHTHTQTQLFFLLCCRFHQPWEQSTKHMKAFFSLTCLAGFS